MALKIVYKICCGIDVHKTFVVACIASTNDKGVTSYESHRFSTYTSGLKTLLQWLLDRNCKDVCMESTGKYWIPVYNILESDCSIVLAHPKYVKAIRGKKTDKKDAKWIADLFKHDLVAVVLCQEKVQIKSNQFSLCLAKLNLLFLSHYLLDFSDILPHIGLGINTRNGCEYVLYCKMFLCIQKSTYMHVYN